MLEIRSRCTTLCQQVAKTHTQITNIPVIESLFVPCCDPRGCSAHKTATRNPDGCQQGDSGLTFLFMYTPAPALQQNDFHLDTFTALLL